MSLNTVQADPETKFLKLPGERILFTSLSEASFSLVRPKLEISKRNDRSKGLAYITNQRLIYLAKYPSAKVASFAVPLLNFHHTHPLFAVLGPNVWVGEFRDVHGSNIDYADGRGVMLLFFFTGGATSLDYQLKFVRDRLREAVEAASEKNTVEERLDGNMEGVDLTGVDLDKTVPFCDTKTSDLLNESRPEPRPHPHRGSTGLGGGSPAGRGYLAVAGPRPPPHFFRDLEELTRQLERTE